MIHFLSEILIILFFTAVLWFGIGWWVASIERAKTQRSRESEWNHRLNTLRRDRDAFRDEVEKSHGRIRVLENRREDGSSPPKLQLLSDTERKKYETDNAELQDKLGSTSRKLLGLSQQVENLHQQSIERDDILEQLKKKLTDTSRTLHEREMHLEQLNQQVTDQTIEAQLQSDETQADSAKAAAQEYEQIIEDLTQRLNAQTENIEANNSESDNSDLSRTISQLREQLHQAQQPDPQINHLQATAKQLKEELDTAHRKLGEQGHEQAAQHDHMQEIISQLREELNVAKLELEERANKAGAELRQLKQHTIELQEELSTSKNELSEQSNKIDPQVEQLQQMTAKLQEELKASKNELAEQANRADLQVEQLEQLTTELQEELVISQKHLADQSRATEPQIESLQSTVTRLQNELDSTRRELVEQAQQSDPQVEQMHNMVAHQQDLIARLQNQNESREEAQNNQLSELREAMAAQEHVVSGLRATLDKAIKTNISNNAQTDRNSQAQGFMAMPHGEPPQPGDFFGTSAGSAQALNIDAINQSGSGPSITLFAQTPSRVDDLKKVNGIGPAFERVLNSIGIFQYEQLANLSPADVIWVAETMRTFPDRLVKGRWVEQAQTITSKLSRG